MCFSATASFTSGTVLLVVGIATLSKVKSISQFPFALIPILFSLQQFCEGFIWLSLTQPDFAEWNKITTMTFLVLAQVLWPVFVPFSIYKLEVNKRNKRILFILTIIGIALSLYLAVCMFLFPVTSEISSHHIHYELAFPSDRLTLIGITYFILTVLPPFISTTKNMRIIGVLNLLSFLITYFLYDEYVISVWCFFAAIISVVILSIIRADQPAKINLTVAENI